MKDLSLDDLDELEDEEDELVLLKYRNQRIAELKALAEKAKYGEVVEISAVDYVEQVNKAGPDVFVVLHLYKQGYNDSTSITHLFFFFFVVLLKIDFSYSVNPENFPSQTLHRELKE